MQERQLLVAALLSIFVAPSPILAQEWIALGGNLNSELDVGSIGRKGNTAIARIRHSIREERGILSMYVIIEGHCGQGYLYIADGEIRSNWSARVAPMPTLPEDERTIVLPTPNPAFLNLYNFICRS
jgi:hypothetical protein